MEDGGVIDAMREAQTGDRVAAPVPAVLGAHPWRSPGHRLPQSPQAAATAKCRRITKRLARLELQLA